MTFASDNTAGASPEIIAALAEVNGGRMSSYGGDTVTAAVTAKFCDLFETDVAVFPVVTGTAANAIGLSCAVPPWGVIFCHQDAHIEWDECAAPELITGGAKIAAIAGPHGKLTPKLIADRLAPYRRGDQHQPQPAAISITQSTEWGTVYTKAEVEAIGDFAKESKLVLHMDGARFANALASTNSAPADLTWRAGVDILSFGATKNGALMAEAILVFNKALADTLLFRRKRAGHLISKMRFVSAQLNAYLSGGLMMRNARAANQAARRLADGLSQFDGVSLVMPVEANAVFAVLPDHLAQGLAQCGHAFYPWGPPADRVYRFVTGFDTTSDQVDSFLLDAKACFTGPASV